MGNPRAPLARISLLGTFEVDVEVEAGGARIPGVAWRKKRAVEVIDFGIAAWDRSADRDPKITSAGSMIGSPAYMSPEQMLTPSEVDARSDVWSTSTCRSRAPPRRS